MAYEMDHNDHHRELERAAELREEDIEWDEEDEEGYYEVPDRAPLIITGIAFVLISLAVWGAWTIFYCSFISYCC